ncbi:MAG: transposase [Sphingomonas sp.]
MSDEEWLRILAQAFPPEACVADVARRHDDSTGLIYTWRRKLREANAESMPEAFPGPGFAEAAMVGAEGAARAGVHRTMATASKSSSASSQTITNTQSRRHAAFIGRPG